MSQLFSSLRFRLVLLVVLASLPPLVLTLHIARQDRQRQSAALRERLQDIIKFSARKEEEMIQGARQLLCAVAASSQVQSGRWGDCDALLRTLFADYPRYANLGVIKPNGDVAASALPLTKPDNLTDRSYFQRALTSRAFAIGDYQVGRITGKPSVNFAYPVLSLSNKVHAVVFAALDLAWLNSSDFGPQMQLPQGATWTKIDTNGIILLRYPPPETSLVGKPLPEKLLFKTFLNQTNGSIQAVDAKGVPVFYDFTSTRSALLAGDVISILSIPRKVLFAEPNRIAMRNLSSVGIVAGLVLGIGWIGSYLLVLRPVRNLVKFSARLATGEFSTRTGLAHRGDELGRLTRSLDQTAEALEHLELQRKSADYALKASETRYRRLFETAQDGILILNADTGQIDDVNPFLTEMLGYSREQLLGNKIWEIGPFKDTKASKAEFRELQREAYVRYEDLPLETCAGKPISVEFVSNVYQANGRKVIQCNIRNITERKQAEAKREEYSRKLQVLSHRLVEVQEAERRYIALELHDEIGQSLTVVEMNLQAALQSPGDDALVTRLKDSLEAIERVLEQVRDLALKLRPSMLDDLGLEPALVWLTHRQAELAGLKDEVRVDALEHRLNPVIETECFRVAQEALTNVVRHGRAKTVTVELHRADGQLHLRVRDDGIGFDVAAIREKAARGASLGLLSMEERAVMTGGGLEITSIPGQGAEVHAWFPLKWQTSASGSEAA